MKHHPSLDLLKKFAAAELDDSLSSVISAHLDQCSVCQCSKKEIEESLASDVFTTQEVESASYDSAWASILSGMKSKDDRRVGAHLQNTTEIEIANQKFELPRSLQALDASSLKWMSFGRGGLISRLKGDQTNSLLLIYLAPNEEVPAHSHTGAEYSFVISGSFATGDLEFETGDFSFSDETVIHAPKATSPDGCLIVSKVEQQLNFFSGFLSPLNGLLWKFLNWKFNRL